jgi:hypothetical protein
MIDQRIIERRADLERRGVPTSNMTDADVDSFFDLQDDVEVEQSIQLSHNTKAVCTKCGREDAPTLYLKREHGRYAMLCRMLDGSGCWPQSVRVLCRNIDKDQVQCIQLAEYVVAFGPDGLVQVDTCSDHLGQTVSKFPATQYNVYPLED